MQVTIPYMEYMGCWILIIFLVTSSMKSLSLKNMMNSLHPPDTQTPTENDGLEGYETRYRKPQNGGG